MRDYSTQAARHRRPKKKGPSTVVGITLSIVLLGAVATGLIWLNQSTSVPYPAESQQPEAQGTEHQSQEAETPTDPEQTATVQQEIPEAPENFYTFYELLITGEVPIDVEAGQSRDEVVAETLKSTIIQVASFRTAEAADDTRVALLFLDLKARVIPPSATNGGWYRIVLGPFKTVRDMRATADVLTKNGFSALVRRE
ncbi:MAG: SPOR domain-containing protein [Pseudomonadota bacterium]|nr:SPOR domain-containing protein [Pseudomonadota bacterium]MEE2820179.1 SPOR domain-containing protein [Pseudomonadota bacterium]